jgi:Ca2+-binding EF-hand superfamily protein
MVRENLARQADLARRHPLNQIPVELGMNFFKDHVGGWLLSGKLTREVFVDRGIDLMVQQRVRHSQQDRNLLYDIFDSMDYDSNGELSLGEWAGGLTVFFKGNMAECIHAVFDCLDQNGDKSLSKSELMEYLKPFVNAMTPPEADALRPLLLKKAAEDIFEEMDFDHDMQISSDEMLQWSKQGNNIVDRIAKIIEHEVYSIWIAEKDRERREAYSKGAAPIRGAYPNANAPQGYSPQRRGPDNGGNYNSQPLNGGGAFGGGMNDGGRGYGGGPGYSNGGAGYGGGGAGYGGGSRGNSGSSPTYVGGGGYGGGYESDYRDLPVPPARHSFITDHHHDSSFGGGY